jgi:hypothetical protein
VVEEEEKKAFISNYFSQLFRTSVIDGGEHLQQLLAAVQPGVTLEMNNLLTAEFTTDEIKRALDAIGDLKAPGPDGMPAIFFKKY